MRTHIKETSKSALLTLCEGNSPVTGEFPTQRASNDKKASICWRHHEQVDLKTQHNITSAASDHKVAGAKTSLLQLSVSGGRLGRQCHNHNWTIYKHIILSARFVYILLKSSWCVIHMRKRIRWYQWNLRVDDLPTRLEHTWLIICNAMYKLRNVLILCYSHSQVCMVLADGLEYIWRQGISRNNDDVGSSAESVPTLCTSNGSWCIGIKGEMSGTVCVTFTWDIYIYIWVVYSFCLFCCLFIIVTWWYIWCIVSQVASKRKYRHVW